MSAFSAQRPSYYARLICDHMKNLPDFYASSLDDVKDALGISEAAFKMGLDWCIERKIIVLDNKPKPVSAFSADIEEEAMKPEGSRLSSMLRSPVPALAEAS
ncbi:MAG: hypothetical protein GC179_26225 [Anaerolineaceae bacterium]|nr:hypothetical protein [Anaerolineaceae bacterium]